MCMFAFVLALSVFAGHARRIGHYSFARANSDAYEGVLKSIAQHKRDSDTNLTNSENLLHDPPFLSQDTLKPFSLAELSHSNVLKGLGKLRLKSTAMGDEKENLAKLKKMMSDPKFREVQKQVQHIDQQMKAMKSDPVFRQLMEQEKRIDEQMKVMEDDPQFQEFQGQARHIDEQTREMAADPNFREFYEQQKRIDEYMQPTMEFRKRKDEQLRALMNDAEIQNLTKRVDKQLNAMRADPKYQKKSPDEYVKEMVPPNFPELAKRLDGQIRTIALEDKEFQQNHKVPKHIDDEIQTLMADPKFREFQQKAKHIDEQMKTMMGNPVYGEFNERLKRLTHEKQALEADPKFRELREKAQRLDREMKTMMADPNFQQFNEQAARAAREIKDDEDPDPRDPESHSLAEVSQSHQQVRANFTVNPSKSFAMLLRTLRTLNSATASTEART